MSFILRLEPPSASWTRDFEIEAARVRAALGPALIALHHIGSTAIPGIYAKPVIDMLADVASLEAMDARLPEMRSLGYEFMGEFGIPERYYFRKNDRKGTRTHQIHAFTNNSPDLTRHLAFRDYLNAHADTAQSYSDLKRSLIQSCNGDFDAYMDGKDAFIKDVEQKALCWAMENAPGARSDRNH